MSTRRTADLRGIIVAVPTPFTPDASAVDAFRRFVREGGRALDRFAAFQAIAASRPGPRGGGCGGGATPRRPAAARRHDPALRAALEGLVHLRRRVRRAQLLRQQGAVVRESDSGEVLSLRAMTPDQVTDVTVRPVYDGAPSGVRWKDALVTIPRILVRARARAQASPLRRPGPRRRAPSSERAPQGRRGSPRSRARARS